MNRKNLTLPIISLIISLLLVGTAAWYRQSVQRTDAQQFDVNSVLPPAATPSSVQKKISAEELSDADGTDGHKCYVAVEEKVYEIKQGRYWKGGQHVTSQGQAMCGKDLTEVIKQSPHGHTKLEELTVVGTLES